MENCWDEQSVKMLFSVSMYTLGIRTARNDDIVVHLVLSDVAPKDNFEDWDYVIEANLHVPSGKITVAGPLEYMPETTCVDLQKSGYYRARVYYGKLYTVSEDGLEGDDHYQIILWPSEDRTLKVLK